MKSQSDAIWATCDREVRPLRATFAACSARCVQEAIGVRAAWALPLQPYGGFIDAAKLGRELVLPHACSIRLRLEVR